MKYSYFWGADIGLTTDPTGVVLVRAVRPAVVIQDGRALDAITGKQVAVPEGTTLAEFIAPQYSILDVQSRKGVTFGQTAREARSVMEDMGNANFTACVDATGLGIGAVDQIRRAGVPTVAITLTSGSKITGSRWSWNLPVALMFSGLFSVMSQGRLKVVDPQANKLIEELREIEKRVSDAGREFFEVATGEGHHGDLVFALGLAVTVAERWAGRQHRVVSLHPGGRQRKPGRPRQGNTAKRVIKQRLEESRARAEADMYRQIGQDDDPFFE